MRQSRDSPGEYTVNTGGMVGRGEILIVSPCSNTPLGEHVVSDFTASPLLVVLVYCQCELLLKAVQTE